MNFMLSATLQTVLVLGMTVKAFSQTQSNCPETSILGLPDFNVENIISGNSQSGEPNLGKLTTTLSTESGFGGWSGSGGDTQHQSDNTWFLGSDTVEYCLKVSDQYSFSKDELSSLVRASLSEWVSFFTKYKISSSQLSVNNNRINISLPDNTAPSMSLRFREVLCNGSLDESPKEKIIFFFGQTNNVIKLYQALNTENAYGLAIRPKYNHQTKRNGGYVWIKNFDRDEESKLKHMILHELGHVFGMRHDSVFVMSEDVVEELENKDLYVADYFGSIESSGWKYRYLPNSPAILTSNKGRRFQELGSDESGIDWILGGSSLELTTSFSVPKKWKKHPNKPQKPLPKPNPNHPKPNPTYGPYKCQSEDFLPNSLLPRAVVRYLGLKPNGCHTISFNRLPNSSEKPVKFFELEIAEPQGGKRVSMRGTFRNLERSREDDLGPGVYTTFKVEHKELNSSRLVNLRMPFDRQEDELPVKGVFEAGDKKFAAQIYNDKGPVVQIFIPEASRWWTLRSIHGCIGKGPCTDEEEED